MIRPMRLIIFMPPLNTSSACCHGTTRMASIMHRPTSAPTSSGSASESILVMTAWMTKQATRATTAAQTFFMSTGLLSLVLNSVSRCSYSRGLR